MGLQDDVREGTACSVGKWAKALVAFWVLLGMFPVFSRMIGYSFLPSVKWMALSELPALVAGLVSAGLFLWVYVVDQQPFTGGELKKVLTCFGAPIFGYLGGSNAVVVAIPMVLALVAGRQVELPYTVERTDRINSKCRSSLELKGLPIVFNEICGVSDEFRQRVARGSRVIVSGRGTDFGVFANGLRRRG